MKLKSHPVMPMSHHAQGKWTEIGPDHPYGLPYEPGQASVILTLAFILLVGVIKVVNSRGNLESL